MTSASTLPDALSRSVMPFNGCKWPKGLAVVNCFRFYIQAVSSSPSRTPYGFFVTSNLATQAGFVSMGFNPFYLREKNGQQFKF